MAVLVGLALGVLLVQVAPAGAVVRGNRPPHRLRARTGTNTQLTLTGLGPGQGVSGFIADTGAVNPPKPYPTSDPTTGFTPRDESFAGVIYGTPTGGAANSLKLYCIDINTDTFLGFGYSLGNWDAASVPNVGYVARLLNEYYPNTGEPAGLTDLNQKAAAVQAAIWFFSDGYVLKTTDPLHSTVAAIANLIISEGPVSQPKPPSLTIDPLSKSGPAGSAVGSFTVTTNHPPATVSATGASMSSDQAGKVPISNGATVPSGQTIWLHSTGPSSAVLQATSEATVPSGNVYLYDGNSDPNSAQKLILAQTGTVTTTVKATAEFLAPGSLIVKKTIAGPAAGSQGKVVIHVVCDDDKDRPDFVIDAGTAAGTTSKTYDDIPAGSMCTVTETSDGSTVATKVVVTGDGQQVTIPAGGNQTVNVTDTYTTAPGSLIVRKTIAGPGAGQQSAVTIDTVCNGTALTPDFVIAAGTPAGSQTKQYDGITVPATCTVTETADGHNSTVSVVVEGSGQTVSVPAGQIIEADVSDTYGLLPGQLEVTKTIAGPQAGQQGMVVIHTVCTPAPAAGTPDVVIPAGTPAGGQSHIYSGIPAGASCVVTETADGHTSAVSVVLAGSPHTTTIPAGGAGAATITDTYGAVPGSLFVTKTIGGTQAGHQGAVTIHAVCNGTAQSPDFVIAAGAPAGSVSHSFDGIPAGSVCTVTETADGATATVTATVAGDDQNVTVPAGQVVSVSLTDVYLGAPGFLRVIKDIRGPAARLHGRIAILVACGGPLHHFAFLIRPRRLSGSVSRRFAGLPAGLRCTVIEVAIGRTHKVLVVAVGRRHTVTIRANRRTTVHLADTFRRVVKVPLPQVTG